jgi:hypothetical protein
VSDGKVNGGVLIGCHSSSAHGLSPGISFVFCRRQPTARSAHFLLSEVVGGGHV